MNIQEDISLAPYSTMGLGGQAKYLTEISTKADLTEAISFAEDKALPILMIGGGSNTIWKDDGFKGLVIVNKIMGYEVSGDKLNYFLNVGAGENWDQVVERSVKSDLTGIEALSLVPGTAGATPIQNVGAYGQEIAQTLVSVEAYDTREKEFVSIGAHKCNFSYRSSRFKAEDKGRFFITSIKLHLKKDNPSAPFYGSVQTYFDDHKIKDFTPAALREAVIAIRRSKLPDPAEVHNSGSFFYNPVVTYDQLESISQQNTAVPHWAFGKDKVKLSAAWLIEQAGFKDYHDEASGMATWPKQSLVLINKNAASTADLLSFKQKITEAVNDKFGITLTQEPEILP